MEANDPLRDFIRNENQVKATPSSDFSQLVMQKIERVSVKKEPEPLVPKTAWYIIALFYSSITFLALLSDTDVSPYEWLKYFEFPEFRIQQIQDNMTLIFELILISGSLVIFDFLWPTLQRFKSNA